MNLTSKVGGKCCVFNLVWPKNARCLQCVLNRGLYSLYVCASELAVRVFADFALETCANGRDTCKTTPNFLPRCLCTSEKTNKNDFHVFVKQFQIGWHLRNTSEVIGGECLGLVTFFLFRPSVGISTTEICVRTTFGRTQYHRKQIAPPLPPPDTIKPSGLVLSELVS